MPRVFVFNLSKIRRVTNRVKFLLKYRLGKRVRKSSGGSWHQLGPLSDRLSQIKPGAVFRSNRITKHLTSRGCVVPALARGSDRTVVPGLALGAAPIPRTAAAGGPDVCQYSHR